MVMKKKKKKLTPVILGIDPGKDGGIVVLKRKKIIKKYRIPTINKKLVDLVELNKIINKYKNREAHIIIEDVHALFGSSAKATWEFGKVVGQIQGCVSASGIPYTLVAPKKWQNEMFQGVPLLKTTKTNQGKKVKANDNKAMALIATKRLFPSTSFIPKGCRKPHDGLVDAALIAEWGRRRIKF